MSAERIKAVIFDLDGTIIKSTIDFRLMSEELVSYLLEEGIPSEILNANDAISNNLTRFREFMRKRGKDAIL